jgi:protein RecA
MVIEKIKVGRVKELLESGKKVKVRTIENQFCNIIDFVDKGFLDTYKIMLDNGLSVKVSKDHKCMSVSGWIKTLDIVPGLTRLLCEDTYYHTVEKIEFLGKQKIVDITVDHPEHCYFGNKILHHNTGKSLLAYHILANTQKRDGIAVYIDIERAADEMFMKRMGVDTSKNFIYPKPPSSIEDVFTYIENIVKVVRTKFPNKEKLVTVVWDSVAATEAKESVENQYGEDRLAPEARAMSRCFKKAMDMLELGYITLVCINQVRQKIGVSFGDPETTPHGKALPFYSSARIKLANTGKIKDPTKRVIGVSCRAKVVKAKSGPPHRQAEFPIYFDWGVDDELSWMEYLKAMSIVSTSGAWSTLKLDGEDHKFQGTAGWKEVLSRAGVRAKLLDIIDDSMTIKFDKKPTTVIIDSLEKKEE